MNSTNTTSLSRKGRGAPIASIDIGTNAVLLLIAEGDKKKLRVIRDEARITRLGEGLHSRPLFLPQARQRTLNVLKEYRSLCDEAGVGEIIAVGTAAFRKAKNALEFIDRVLKETGIKIRIISGEEEARLSYLSATTDFGELENLYVLDIGGGSTEIISKEGSVSMDLGAVVLTEKIVSHDPPTDEEFQNMSTEIDQKVPGSFFLNRAPALIGLAGSVTTLSAIKQKLPVWDGSRVQGSVLTLKDIGDMMALFRRTTNEERQTIPGMVRGREDTILAGTLILRQVMERLGVDRLTVSDRGLRYGLFYERLPY